MTDNNEQEQKRPLTLARPGGRLELRKPVETGQVRQSFPHGRSKTVMVEVRKKRVVGPGSGEPAEAPTGAGKEAAAKVAALTAAGKVKPAGEEEPEEEAPIKRGLRPEVKKPAALVRREEPRRRGKMTVTRALDSDADERMRSLASVRRAREKLRQQQVSAEPTKIVRDVVIPETITVQELANRMAERSADVIKSL